VISWDVQHGNQQMSMLVVEIHCGIIFVNKRCKSQELPENIDGGGGRGCLCSYGVTMVTDCPSHAAKHM
jgi:hypothetical protein